VSVDISALHAISPHDVSVHGRKYRFHVAGVKTSFICSRSSALLGIARSLRPPARRLGLGLEFQTETLPVVHRPCLKLILHKSFNILDNSGLCPELSTCVLLGLYRRSRLRFSSRWCWFWPARARGFQPSASKAFGQLDARHWPLSIPAEPQRSLFEK
jgi:hypothetical protein